MKLSDMTFKQIAVICANNKKCNICPFYNSGTHLNCLLLQHLPAFQDLNREVDNEVATPNDSFSEEKDHVIIGTHWNSQQGPDGYRLQFETDNKTLYKYMEKAAQLCIDIANQR